MGLCMFATGVAVSQKKILIVHHDSHGRHAHRREALEAELHHQRPVTSTDHPLIVSICGGSSTSYSALMTDFPVRCVFHHFLSAERLSFLARQTLQGKYDRLRVSRISVRMDRILFPIDPPTRRTNFVSFLSLWTTSVAEYLTFLRTA